jgi:multimeric flavodoxin WrbA
MSRFYLTFCHKGGMMIRVVVINGSPRKDKGNTAMILNPFTEGMRKAGADFDFFYTKNLKLKPCTGQMQCWWKTPGECYIKDDMQKLYPKLREANILILATPVYIPLPGEMQIVINRLCPLIKPLLETREGRTRARLHDDVRLQKVLLVSTGGWWEKENFDIVIHIVKEFAECTNVEFAGAVIRPHAFLMKKKGELTKDGETVLDAVRKAGYEFIKNGRLSEQILDTIRRPLISQEELRQRNNRALQSISDLR